MRKFKFTPEGRNTMLSAIKKLKDGKYEFNCKELFVLSKLYADFTGDGEISTKHIVFAWNLLITWQEIEYDRIQLNFKNGLYDLHTDTYKYYKEFYDYIINNASEYEKYYCEYIIRRVIVYHECMLKIYKIIDIKNEKQKRILVHELSWVSIKGLQDLIYFTDFLRSLDLFKYKLN